MPELIAISSGEETAEQGSRHCQCPEGAVEGGDHTQEKQKADKATKDETTAKTKTLFTGVWYSVIAHDGRS